MVDERSEMAAGATGKHWTAWITTDPGMLAGQMCDVVVLRDRWDDFPGRWVSAGEPEYWVETPLTAGGEHPALTDEVERLLDLGGWVRVGSWEVVPTGLVATVQPK